MRRFLTSTHLNEAVLTSTHLNEAVLSSNLNEAVLTSTHNLWVFFKNNIDITIIHIKSNFTAVDIAKACSCDEFRIGSVDLNSFQYGESIYNYFLLHDKNACGGTTEYWALGITTA